MKLSELKPVWLEHDGKRVGFTFLCPCCLKDRLLVLSEPTPFKEQVKLMHAAMGTVPEDEHDWPCNWVPMNPKAKWSFSNLTDFNTMTVRPSVDASASGNWHGYITDGEAKLP